LDEQTVTLRKIDFGSDDFRKECELRNEVVRVPIGLCLYDEDLDRERQQLHFGLFDQCGDLIACVIAIVSSCSKAKIRPMAVRGEHQGKGYGRRVIHDLEEYLALQGVVHLDLHARLTAVGFYTKLGYAKVGQEFMEVGIPHVGMEKYIRPGSTVDGDKSRAGLPPLDLIKSKGVI
jgi:predicted GNAT family N-acyltransferase